ncbi:MAG: iron-containing alcohol dehydrogenase [Lentisphaeria bacterium]|nr:iron-containing alcohol dehydrogenase [Lentisphaeria bacterium]
MSTNLSFTFAVPAVILLGAGKPGELSAQAMPGKHKLIVISNGESTRARGYPDRLEEQLDRAGVSHVVFGGVQANPAKDNVQAGTKTAREHGCDFIVALGGGSVIDASKAIAAMAVNDGDLWDFIRTLAKLQEDCGVAGLSMPDYGIRPEEFPVMARNAGETMGFLFACDRDALSDDDCVAICKASYR